jgi:murein DD-endopeptidase MepM/ murein hydrolase activator NlpD
MFKKVSILLSLLIVFQGVIVFAQPTENEKEEFRSPVDFDIKLSGNFGELRGSHFHTGIDIKTKGTIGHNIYAIADGYVSRIKVSPFGYGNALYVRHDNGYTSVYGHLDRFNIQMEQYVRTAQYRMKKFAVNLFPEANEIRVKKGDVIGLSGNSGGSMGPHLHFEIRETKSEKPLNPLFWNLGIPDNIPPRFHNLIINPLSKKAQINGKHERAIFELEREQSTYFVKDKRVITVSDTIGVLAYVNDYLNNTYNRCGVFELKLFVDGELYYYLKMDDLSFAENRYILSHIDYGLKLDTKINAHKCYVEEGNHFGAYQFVKKSGRIFLKPGQKKNLKIVATDVEKNKAVLNFTLLGVPSDIDVPEKDFVQILIPGKVNYFESEGVKLKLPGNSLYRKVFFQYNKEPAMPSLYSDIYNIHNDREPLHERYSLSIKGNDIPFRYNDKIYLASVNNDNKISIATSNVEYKNGWLSAKIRSFGSFAIAVDTIRPQVTPLNISENKNMNGETRIAFKISDDETGIDKYNGYINGQWVLFQYDAKNDLIYYEFDDYMPKSNDYVLKLIVTDNKNNTAVKTISFTMPEMQSNRN